MTWEVSCGNDCSKHKLKLGIFIFDSMKKRVVGEMKWDKKGCELRPGHRTIQQGLFVQIFPMSSVFRGKAALFHLSCEGIMTCFRSEVSFSTCSSSSWGTMQHAHELYRECNFESCTCRGQKDLTQHTPVRLKMSSFDAGKTSFCGSVDSSCVLQSSGAFHVCFTGVI